MPNATARGWLTTPDEDAANDMEMWLLDLAQQLENRLAARYTQRGSVVINVSASPSASDTITYPEAFAGVPQVFLTSRSSSFITSHGTPGLADCGFSVRHVDNTATTQSVTVDWLAVGSM